MQVYNQKLEEIYSLKSSNSRLVEGFEYFCNNAKKVNEKIITTKTTKIVNKQLNLELKSILKK